MKQRRNDITGKHPAVISIGLTIFSVVCFSHLLLGAHIDYGSLPYLNSITKSTLKLGSAIASSDLNESLVQQTQTKDINYTMPSQTSLQNKWVVYENPTHNLRLSYPFDWKKIDGENNITFISPSKTANASFLENIVINISPSGNVPLDESESLRIIEHRQNKKDFRLIDFGGTEIAENPAYKIVYTYRDGRLLKSLDLRTIVGGKLYSFIFTADSDEYMNYLPVMNYVVDSLEIQELAKKSVVKQDYPSFKVGTDPFDIVVDPLTGKLYIANFRFHSVSVIDGSNDKLISEIKVGRFPLSISVNTDLGTVYVANSHSNSISVIDGSTNEITEDITVGNEPVLVTVDKAEKGINALAFVANLESNTVSVIDATKNEVISPTLNVGIEPSSMAVNEVANRLYIANRGSNTVSVIDYFMSGEGKFINSTVANISVQKYPSDIAINPITNRIYVANYYSDTVSVIDGSTNTVINTVKSGANPSSIAVNPETNRIYIANYGSDTVSVLDGETDKLLVNISVGSFPYKVYRNPITDIIYVINLGSRTMSQISDTSLLAGITYNVEPSNSGQLDCNGKSISDDSYVRYAANSQVVCKAQPNSNYIFQSWSANVPLQSDIASTTAFESSDYGNITANFQVPVEVTLPKAYWEQLYIVLISIMVPAIAGWSIPAIAGYINSVRQRKVLRNFMGKILLIQNTTHDDMERRKMLEDIQIETVQKLTEGKISESQYDILNNKISENLANIKS